MSAYSKALMVLIPAIFLVIILEALYAYFKGNFNFRTMDTVASLTAGMSNVIKNVLGLTVVIYGYGYFFEHFALVERETTWVTFVLALLFLDFGTYWYHRLAHSVNIFWNRHVIHHSGEDFNTAAALRQSISKFVNISVIFFLPAALLGVSPMVVAIVTPFHLFVQVWYHTEHVGKLGWLEYIIVTPSQHRVHHALNPVYLDKNMSPVFCVWDRLFGTFQEELDDEPCVFGVTRQVNTWNPIRINLNHIWLLAQDAWRAEKLMDKLMIWFKPTGWRPKDVAEKYPVPKADHKAFVKYDTPASNSLKIWTWVQFLVLVGMVFHLLYKIVDMGSPAMFIYGGFLFLMIYSYTTLMDRDPNALWMEIVKSGFALGFIYSTGDWFLIDEVFAGGTMVVAAYQVLSMVVVTWFVVKEIGWEKDEALERIEG